MGSVAWTPTGSRRCTWPSRAWMRGYPPSSRPRFQHRGGGPGACQPDCGARLGGVGCLRPLPGQVGSTPEGEYVVVKPSNSTPSTRWAFAPGGDEGAPGASRDDATGAGVVPVPWRVEYAFLTGGNLRFWGSAEDLDPGVVRIAPRSTPTECSRSTSRTMWTGAPPRPLRTWRPMGPARLARCPTVGIPSIDPRIIYPYATVVLCPNGKAYGGRCTAPGPIPTPGHGMRHLGPRGLGPGVDQPT